MSDDKPTPTIPGFLFMLSKATEQMPDSVKAIVTRLNEKPSFAQTCRYYEIRQEHMLRDLIAQTVAAVDAKMATDFQAHQMGTTTFQKVLFEAIAFALVAGAQLAKDKKI